jgi:hypothetical protein
VAKPKVLEKDILKFATDTLATHGWKWWHVPAPMVAGKGEWRPYRKAAGLPDIFAMHHDPPRFLIVETKGTGGKLTEAQREFLEMARRVADTIEEHDSYGHEQIMGVVVLVPGLEDVFVKIVRSKVMSSS